MLYDCSDILCHPEHDCYGKMLGYIIYSIHRNIIIIIIINNNNVDHLTEIACSVSFLRRLYHQPPITSHSVLRIIIDIVIIIIIIIIIQIIVSPSTNYKSQCPANCHHSHLLYCQISQAPPDQRPIYF